MMPKIQLLLKARVNNIGESMYLTSESVWSIKIEGSKSSGYYSKFMLIIKCVDEAS